MPGTFYHVCNVQGRRYNLITQGWTKSGSHTCKHKCFQDYSSLLFGLIWLLCVLIFRVSHMQLPTYKPVDFVSQCQQLGQ